MFLLVIPLLPFTHFITPTINGARRWVNLGILTLQPSELAKFAVVVWCAMLAAKKGEQLRDFKHGVLPFVVILGPVVGLVFREAHLSMALLVALLAGSVLFTAGARIGHFLALGAAAGPLLFGAVATAQYRLARVLTFLNPGAAPAEATWQVQQSLTGIGAGQLLGAGFGQGQQKLGYLPYAYSDFIFSTIGEEWGFLGVVMIALLFGTFVWLGFRIARNAPDPFGQLLATGITVMIGLSVVLHIGEQLGLEARILPPHPFGFYLLPMEPLYRRQWWRNVLLPLMWLRATRATERVLREEQPAIVIGTGGYAAGPVVLRAQQVGIP